MRYSQDSTFETVPSSEGNHALHLDNISSFWDILTNVSSRFNKNTSKLLLENFIRYGQNPVCRVFNDSTPRRSSASFDIELGQYQQTDFPQPIDLIENPIKCRISGPIVEGGKAGEILNATLLLDKTCSLFLQEYDFFLKAKLTNSDMEEPHIFLMKLQKACIFEGSVTLFTSGQYVLNVFMQDKVTKSKFYLTNDVYKITITPGKAFGINCYCEESKIFKTELDKLQTLKIVCSDVYKNRCKSSGDSVIARGVGGTIIKEVVDLQNGMYEIAYLISSQKKTRKKITSGIVVLVNEVPLNGSPIYFELDYLSGEQKKISSTRPFDLCHKTEFRESSLSVEKLSWPLTVTHPIFPDLSIISEIFASGIAVLNYPFTTVQLDQFEIALHDVYKELYKQYDGVCSVLSEHDNVMAKINHDILVKSKDIYPLKNAIQAEIENIKNVQSEIVCFYNQLEVGFVSQLPVDIFVDDINEIKRRQKEESLTLKKYYQYLSEEHTKLIGLKTDLTERKTQILAKLKNISAVVQDSYKNRMLYLNYLQQKMQQCQLRLNRKKYEQVQLKQLHPAAVGRFEVKGNTQKLYSALRTASEICLKNPVSDTVSKVPAAAPITKKKLKQPKPKAAEIKKDSMALIFAKNVYLPKLVRKTTDETACIEKKRCVGCPSKVAFTIARNRLLKREKSSNMEFVEAKRNDSLKMNKKELLFSKKKNEVHASSQKSAREKQANISAKNFSAVVAGLDIPTLEECQRFYSQMPFSPPKPCSKIYSRAFNKYYKELQKMRAKAAGAVLEPYQSENNGKANEVTKISDY